jgi:hypothetical protein
MTKLKDILGPGTAGLAQRVYSAKNYDASSEDSSADTLYVLKPNKILSCGHNQY